VVDREIRAAEVVDADSVVREDSSQEGTAAAAAAAGTPQNIEHIEDLVNEDLDNAAGVGSIHTEVDSHHKMERKERGVLRVVLAVEHQGQGHIEYDRIVAEALVLLEGSEMWWRRNYLVHTMDLAEEGLQRRVEEILQRVVVAMDDHLEVHAKARV